jgi:hypothetical protein
VPRNKSRLISLLVGLLVLAGVFFLLQATNPFYPDAVVKVRGVTSQKAGVEISYDFGEGFKGYQVEHIDLSPQDERGAFESVFNLPNIEISRLKLVMPSSVVSMSTVGVSVVTDGQEVSVATKKKGGQPDAVFVPLKGVRKPHFNRFLVIFHLLIAGVVAIISYCLVSLPRLLGLPAWGDVARYIFIEEKRWRFWAMFVCSSAVHSLWLLAYWPAAMTNDSWISLGEAQSLVITDWHPYTYTLWLLALTHLFHTVAAVGVLQILATSAVVSGILFFAWQRGVSGILVGVFYVLFICSIPIGLFNTLVWKDIPFSIGILLLSFLIFRVAYVRQVEGRYARIARYHWVLFGVLCVVVCTFRHNGLIFYGLIPVLAWSRLERGDYIKLLATVGTVFMTFNYVIPAVVGIKKTSASPQQEYRTVLAIMTHFNYYSKDRANDRRIIEEATKMSWGEISSLYPKNWFDAWDKSDIQKRQFFPGNGHTEEYTKDFVGKLAMNNLPIVLGSRTYEFLHSIGIDQSAYDQTTDYYQNPLQLFGTNLQPPGAMRFKVSIESSPPFEWIRGKLLPLAQWSMHYDGLFSRQVLIWNLLVFLMLFVGLIFLEGGLSPIGLFTLPSLASTTAVFLAGAGESWRYFYYVYLCGIVVIPLYLCVLKNMRRS